MGITVLIVDDEDNARATLEEFLVRLDMKSSAWEP